MEYIDEFGGEALREDEDSSLAVVRDITERVQQYELLEQRCGSELPTSEARWRSRALWAQERGSTCRTRML